MSGVVQGGALATPELTPHTLADESVALSPGMAAATASRTTNATATTTTLKPLSAAPQLSSLASAAKKLYLNFVGGEIPPEWWSSASHTPAYDQDADATTFNDSELASITEIWKRVADKYAPFNVDVTTVDPGNRNDNQTFSVMIGGDGAWYNPAYGGVAMIGGFSNEYSNTAFVFAAQAPYYTSFLGNIITHESAHGFGLDHQANLSLPPDDYWHEYNQGGYDPTTGQTVGPILGDSNTTLAGWWNGPSSQNADGSVVMQNDLTILGTTLGYRPDDAGNAIASATPLGEVSSAVLVRGTIETTTDTDVRSFTTRGGSISLNVNLNAEFASMLSPLVELRNASGALVATAQDNGSYQSLSATIPSGTYYLVVKGSGWVTVDGPNTLDQYADIGTYTIDGGIVGGVEPADTDPDDTIAESSARTDRQKNIGSNVDLELNPATDVDMIGFKVTAGQRVAFDVDSRSGSNIDTHLRLFTANGVELASNDNGREAGETASGFSYLEHTFSTAGTYYVGLSLSPNRSYDPNAGTGDVPATGATGLYRLRLVNVAVTTPPPPPPPPPPTPTPTGAVTERTNATSTAIKMGDGRVFSAASGFTGGTESSYGYEVANTTDDTLYTTRRWGKDFGFARSVPNGTYNVTLYFAEPVYSGNGKRVFDVFAENGKVLADFDLHAVGGAKSAIARTIPVTVTDGQLNLRFLAKADNAIVSAVMIAPQLEAEVATRVGPSFSTQHAGFTGTGFADFNAASGEYVQFTVSAATSGKYLLTFRYANGGTTNRPLELRVNNTVTGSSIPFAPTGGWTTWKDVTVAVDLLAGSNTVRLTSIGSGGGNLDSLVVT
ncbi:MAG TPA: malectin domain-containing carbohydrate-binding protein [Tepidisphaeraceae bacterium]|jgi:hypothetical protein|nr:malectin domain-containing carbohydrate-binding protein [Tepidisphaeraceae bacterium]